MELTQEFLKIFLFTGVITGTVILILFSGGQLNTIQLDYVTASSATYVTDMLHVTYSIYNTGNTDITTINVKPDCCAISSINLLDSTPDVVWENAVGVSVDGNSITNEVHGAWGSGASSVRKIESGEGYVTAVLAANNRAAAIGFGRADANSHIFDIDFGIYASGRCIMVFENAGFYTPCDPYNTGDVIKIIVRTDGLGYYHKDKLLYTSTRPITYPLLVDTSFSGIGATLNDVRLITYGLQTQYSPYNVPVAFTLYPRQSTGFLSNIFSIDTDMLNDIDEIMVTFEVEDHLGNKRTKTELVKIG